MVRSIATCLALVTLTAVILGINVGLMLHKKFAAIEQTTPAVSAKSMNASESRLAHHATAVPIAAAHHATAVNVAAAHRATAVNVAAAHHATAVPVAAAHHATALNVSARRASVAAPVAAARPSSTIARAAAQENELERAAPDSSASLSAYLHGTASSPQSVGPWTVMPEGCACFFNERLTSECACCKHGAVQCGEVRIDRCVPPGKADFCIQDCRTNAGGQVVCKKWNGATKVHTVNNISQSVRRTTQHQQKRLSQIALSETRMARLSLNFTIYDATMCSTLPFGHHKPVKPHICRPQQWPTYCVFPPLKNKTDVLAPPMVGSQFQPFLEVLRKRSSKTPLSTTELAPWIKLEPLAIVNTSCKVPEFELSGCRTQRLENDTIGQGPTGKQRSNGHVKLIDMILFAGEVSLLEARLMEFEGVVDHVLLVEAEFDHKGHSRAVLWPDLVASPRFKNFENLVVHSVLTNKELQTMGFANDMWLYENAQTRHMQHLVLRFFQEKKLSASNDILIIGHLDEIPSRHVLWKLKHCELLHPLPISGVIAQVMGGNAEILQSHIPCETFPGHSNYYFRPFFTTLKLELELEAFFHNASSSSPTSSVDRQCSVMFGGKTCGTRFKNRFLAFDSRGRSGNERVALAGGNHFSSSLYMPFWMTKQLGCSECGGGLPGYTFSNLLMDQLRFDGVITYTDLSNRRHVVGKKVNRSTRSTRKLTSVFNTIFPLPWFMECNRNRFPEWFNLRDPRVAPSLWPRFNSPFDPCSEQWRKTQGQLCNTTVFPMPKVAWHEHVHFFQNTSLPRNLHNIKSGTKRERIAKRGRVVSFDVEHQTYTVDLTGGRTDQTYTESGVTVLVKASNIERTIHAVPIASTCTSQAHQKHFQAECFKQLTTQRSPGPYSQKQRHPLH